MTDVEETASCSARSGPTDARIRQKDRTGEVGAARCEANLCSTLPCFGRRVGADPIPFGQVSVQTTERYLGCKQRIRSAINDRIGIEP
jgi:hypothetical protein